MPKDGDIGARLEWGEASLEFIWREDRYQQIFRCGEALLESGEPKPFRPPVFTELHRQEDILFASGAGDKCHWSASIHADDGFIFDIACRVAGGTRGIGGAYLGIGWSINATRDDENPPAIESANHARENWLVAPVALPFDPPCTVRYRYRVGPE